MCVCVCVCVCVCACVCVCLYACGVSAVFAQLQVLFSGQTTSKRFSHELISSFNTNDNEAQGRPGYVEIFYAFNPVGSVTFTV